MKFKNEMYVRCPYDFQDSVNPRVFVCGKIVGIDQFSGKAKVRIYDPYNTMEYFQYFKSGVFKFSLHQLTRCTLFTDTEVKYHNVDYVIISHKIREDHYYEYYIRNKKTKEVKLVCEKEIEAAYNNGAVKPIEQMMLYEFQHPVWYFGRSIVQRNVGILDNTLFGFKELAGSKMLLLPHQLNTIMRCLQDLPCRYMLADEVGMGKTIEAISILKLYIKERVNQKVLIVVPSTLKEQWKTELFFKFNINLGQDANNNEIYIESYDEIHDFDLQTSWDFIVADEVHGVLKDQTAYQYLLRLSKNTKNILLLSATPVQERRKEYLALLRLLDPKKYMAYDEEQFGHLIEKQRKIVQKSSLVLSDLYEYEEYINECVEDEADPHESEDCEEVFEEIQEDLEEICDYVNDPKLTSLLEKIDYDQEDLGVYAIKVLLSYICSNYQIESNIIRNRRKLLENSEQEEQLLATRKLVTITYELDEDKNTYETMIYKQLKEYIEQLSGVDHHVVVDLIRPLLQSFFSSSKAFYHVVKQKAEVYDLPEEFMSMAATWVKYEEYIVDNIADILDDPDAYDEYYSCRMVSVLNYVYEECYDSKTVLFTDYLETFEMYEEALSNIYSSEQYACYGKTIPELEAEVNTYRFQNVAECSVLLCDYTGGEGRNFQCADYVVHIDLPWNANTIEQRIGRLDRLERDPNRQVVYSVVPYAEQTFEEALFNFWNKGLNIFEESLSGMEIIMNDINNEIYTAVCEDFNYGLFERIDKIVEKANKMKKEIIKEQNYDTASCIFKPMYHEIDKLVRYYNNNENELFFDTMYNWAHLSGFSGDRNQYSIVTYTPHGFSFNSALNSVLIPPNWNEYFDSSQAKYLCKVKSEYNKKQYYKNRIIQGTYSRKLALKNDYIHFFAPGDAIFDCITNNAIKGNKGQTAAFVSKADINWTGLIFTWSASPNMNALLEQNVSLYALGPYKIYLSSEEIITVVPIQNEDDVKDSKVISEYNRILQGGYLDGKKAKHLGQRKSNKIGEFKEEYPQEQWEKLLHDSYAEAKKKAIQIVKKLSNIAGAKEEMQRVLSSMKAKNVFYGYEEHDVSEIEKQFELILNTIKKPVLNNHGIAFIRMEKVDEE